MKANQGSAVLPRGAQRRSTPGYVIAGAPPARYLICLVLFDETGAVYGAYRLYGDL